MTSSHARYRSRLAAVADDALLAAAIGMDRLVRLYGRFHPDVSPWAVLAVGVADDHPLRIELHDRAVAGTVDHPDLGHVRVLSCTADPALTGLAGVLDQLADARVVRYRPGKRCTVRGVAGGIDRFVKLGPHAESRHSNGVELWRSATNGELGFDVARPLGIDPRRGAVHHGVIAGGWVANALLGRDGDACARRLGRALGTLAASGVRPAATAPPSTQLDRTRRAAKRATDRIPSLGERLSRVLADLELRHGRLRDRLLVPVHGAPHSEQWLDGGGRLGLVDFDRFALGEPELDIATFLAELDSERSLTLPVDTIERAMVDGFESIGPALDAARLDLYRRHKRLAKITRTAWSLRPEADERAERHLSALLDS